jgi:hypothetical protein
VKIEQERLAVGSGVLDPFAIERRAGQCRGARDGQQQSGFRHASDSISILCTAIGHCN